MPQLRVRMLQLRILHGATKTEDPRTTTKTQHSQIKTNQQTNETLNKYWCNLSNRSDSLLPTMVNTKLTEDILPAQRTFTSFGSMREIQEKKNELNIQAADGTDNKCYGNWGWDGEGWGDGHHWKCLERASEKQLEKVKCQLWDWFGTMFLKSLFGSQEFLGLWKWVSVEITS